MTRAELETRCAELEQQLQLERTLRETEEARHLMEVADRRLDHVMLLAQAILTSENAPQMNLPDIILLAKTGLDLAEHLLEEDDTEAAQ